MPFNWVAAAMAVALVASAGVWLAAQSPAPQVFQFVVSVTDAAGTPVTDLRPDDVVMSEDGVRQQVVKVEPLLALANRLTTLLPEWGCDLAALHARQTTQFRVTVERWRGGNLRNPRIELARPGLNGAVTLDGYLP